MSFYVPNFAEVLAVSRAHGRDSEAPHLWDELVFAVTGHQGGGNEWKDIAGYDNHGALTNGPTWALGDPRSGGYALDFDGGNNHVLLDNVVSLPDETAWSLSVWLQPKVVNNFNAILGYDNTAGKQTRWFWGATSVAFYNNANAGATFTYTLTANRWQLLTLTQTPDGVFRDLDLYVDGKFVQNTRGALADYSATIERFGHYGDDANGCDGVLNSVVIHDRVLTPNEIQLLYERPNAMFTLRQRVFPAAVAVAPTDGVARIIFLTGAV